MKSQTVNFGSLGFRLPFPLVMEQVYTSTYVLSRDTFPHMVKGMNERLDSVFAALADPTRRAIVARLAHGEASVSQLAAPFPVSLPAVTKHLSVLRRAGIVKDRKLGRVRLCRLATDPLRQAERWVAEQRLFWDQRMDGLAAHLEADGRGE